MSKETDEGYESDTEEKKQEQVAPTPSIEQQEADDGIFQAPASTSTSTSSISALSGGVSADGQTLDPIIEAIRKEVLEKQRDILREYFANTNPELAEQIAKEEEDKKFRAFLSNPDNQGLINKAFEDSDTKKKLEAAEIAGYRNVHNTFSAANGYPGGFKPMQWNDPAGGDNTRAQIVKNDVGDELCTLNETTVKTKPFTVAKQDGTQVQISSYREIDFPVKLDKADGSMHLSMVALKADGTKPSKDKAVYFTAHYEEGPNGKPLLKEISSPQPLKFAGDGPDAVAYIEHGGEIYTLAVTRGKYKEMMKEVELNKGQSVDLSQTEDIIIGQGQSRGQETNEPVITPNQELKSSIEPPSPVQTRPLPQSQQPESPEIPNPLLNAATDLSQAMQNLLNELNTSLKNEVEKTDLIKHVAEQILQEDGAGFEQKQTGIKALTENVVNNTDLTAEEKATGVGGILETIKNDKALSDLEKAQMFKDTVDIALDSKDLESQHKQQIIGEAVDAGLSLKDEASRAETITGITQSVIDSNLTSEEKVTGVGGILETIKNDQNTPDLEKSKMLEATVAITLNSENLEPKQKQQMLEKAVDVGLNLKDDASRAAAIDGITDAVIKSNLSTEDKGTMLIAVGDKVNASELSNAEKQKLLGSVLKKGVEASVLTAEQQQLMQQNLDKIAAAQEKENKIAAVKGILVDPMANKSEAIKNITMDVLDSAVKPEVKAETVERITQTVAESSLDAKDKTDITKGVGQAIATNKTVTLAEQITITESAEKGVASSTADLEDKKLMTKGLVDGIYEGKASPEVTSEMTKAVSSGIDKSTATPEDQKALKDAAMEAALERETQNLNKDLSQDTDLHAAARKVANALKDVIDPILEAYPEKTEVSKKQITEKTSDIVAGITEASKDVPTPGEEELEKSKESVVSTEEEVVKKTSGILSDISKLAVEKVNNFRAMLSPNGNLKTIEEKRAESEQQINKSVADYKTIDDKYKPQHEQQQGSYDNTKELAEKKLFIENLKLDDKEKIKLISTLIQNEADNKKKGTVNNITMLTENRTKLEEKVAIQDKSKVGYDAQLKPRKDTGRVP